MGSGSLEIYRKCTPVTDARYDPDSDRAPSVVIIEALADAKGVEASELPPLFEYVDLEAIDFMFQKHPGSNQDTVLSFRVEDWNVFVRGDGRVRVCDARESTDPEPVFEAATV